MNKSVIIFFGIMQCIFSSYSMELTEKKLHKDFSSLNSVERYRLVAKLMLQLHKVNHTPNNDCIYPEQLKVK